MFLCVKKKKIQSVSFSNIIKNILKEFQKPIDKPTVL